MPSKLDELRMKKRKARINFRGVCNSEYDIPNIKPIYPRRDDPNIKLKGGSKNLKKDEKVSCLVDTAFKTLIMNDKNPKYLAGFMSKIYNLTYEDAYNNLIMLKNEFNRSNMKSKGYRGDGIVQIHTNQCDFEVNRSEVEERNIHYLDMMFESTLSYKGERTFAAACSLVNINNYRYPHHDETIEIYVPRDRFGNLLTYCKQIMNIYVPNIQKKYYNNIKLNEIEKWVLVMSLTNAHLARKIAEGDELLMELIEDSIKIKEDKNFIERYDFENAERESTMAIGYDAGEAKGIKIGKKQGIQQGMKQGRNKE